MSKGISCPKCGSTDTRKCGWKILSGRKAQQHQCKKCGVWFRSKETIPL